MRQESGAVVCPSCRRLVDVKVERCPFCETWNPGLFGYAKTLGPLLSGDGFAQIVTWACAVLYIASLLRDPSLGLNLSNPFTALSPTLESGLVFGASGSAPIVAGRWWTLLSASWLHGSLLHILFNVMWVRALAPAVGRFVGPGRLGIIYLASGIVGFAMSSGYAIGMDLFRNAAQPGQVTLGASASVFGLLGALVHYGRKTGSSAMGRQVWTWALLMFFIGFVSPSVDNLAHLGGFVGGYAASMLLNPLKPERPIHLVVAAAGLALTVLAVLASLLVPLPQFVVY